MIEEYERKISKTKSLLEEEKNKVAKKGLTTEEDSLPSAYTLGCNPQKQATHEPNPNAKSTPEFKSKRELNKTQGGEEISSKSNKNKM